MSLRRGARLAAAVFLVTWIPVSLWRGLRFGAAFRIDGSAHGGIAPLVEGVIQIAAVMLVPSLLLALLAFALWAWREERRG
ncbi:MAG: hypothetical protein RL139_571 [Gemmatimonadota bacterium]|jgi:hypothetical protein